MHGLVVFFGQIFDNGAGRVAVATDRADDDIGPLETGFEVVRPLFHVTIMVLEDAPAAFDQFPVERGHA